MNETEIWLCAQHFYTYVTMELEKHFKNNSHMRRDLGRVPWIIEYLIKMVNILLRFTLFISIPFTIHSLFFRLSLFFVFFYFTLFSFNVCPFIHIKIHRLQFGRYVWFACQYKCMSALHCIILLTGRLTTDLLAFYLFVILSNGRNKYSSNTILRNWMDPFWTGSSIKSIFKNWLENFYAKIHTVMPV